MNEEHFLRKLIRRLKPVQRVSNTKPEPQQDYATLRKLLHMVVQTDEVELSCDEVFELLDQCAEMAVRHEDAARLLPLVKKHHNNCRDCREEYEALVRILEASEEFSNISS